MIKLYSQPTCGMCKVVHMQLDRAKIEYEDIQDLEIMKAKGICHTPTLETEDGKLLQGSELMKFIQENKRN